MPIRQPRSPGGGSPAAMSPAAANEHPRNAGRPDRLSRLVGGKALGNAAQVKPPYGAFEAAPFGSARRSLRKG